MRCVFPILAACSHPTATQPDSSAIDTSVDTAVDAMTDLTGPRGVYVPTFNARMSDADLQVALQMPAVDGFFIARNWADVEPTPGNFAFESVLGTDIRAVAAAHKHATIAIAAGINRPDDVCASTTCLDLIVRFKQADHKCIHESLPLPWDPVVQARFGRVIAALGTYLASDSTLAATVVEVKISGFNDHDAETILPIQDAVIEPCTTGDACQPDGTCHETDTAAALQGAGYTVDAALAAYRAFAAQTRAAFRGLPIGSQISSHFPAPGGTTLPVTMVQQLLADGTLRPVTVQDQGLTATSGVDDGTRAGQAAGVPVGFQMLSFVSGNSPCLMAGPGHSADPCDEAVLRAAVDLGVASGASWLEIYKKDVKDYPATIEHAHAALVP
jgi:hypothetical protein